MQINFTKLYRLWHLLTAVSVIGIFITFYAGYNQTLNTWSASMLNLHTIFIGMLLGGVVTRLYMAFTGINAVPLMHLIRARSVPQAVEAIGYIAMCTALLITLVTEMYILLALDNIAMTWIHELRNNTQPIFVLMVIIHISYVVYNNKVNKSGTIKKLLEASE
jgi:hypothetical protein